MPIFNPGDRVRRIRGNDYGGVVRDGVYTVSDVQSNFLVFATSPRGYLFSQDYFELVEPVVQPEGEEYTCYLVIFGKPDGSRSPQIASTEERLNIVIGTFTRVGWTVKAKKRIKVRI